MSVRLYVGNLPKELDRKELEALFAEEFGDNASTKLITDRKTGKCRGFAFVTVKTSEQADQVLEKFNGYVFKESPLKIEKALPRSKGKEEESRVSSSPEASGSSNSPRHSSKTKSRRSDSSYTVPSQACFFSKNIPVICPHHTTDATDLKVLATSTRTLFRRCVRVLESS